MKKLILIIPILAVLLGSCQKEGTDETIRITPVIKPPSEVIEGSISGYVTEWDQSPISDASVWHHEDYTTTDENGRFVFDNIDLFTDGSLIEAQKDGFFVGSKKFYASDENIVNLQLSPKSLLEKTSTSVGGKIDINEAYVVLPSGSYIDSRNQAYSGNINVFGKWLNPTKDESYEMPGDLTGYDIDRKLKALICFSVLKVELEDENEMQIQLPENQKATINFPIPSELLKFAPDQISLWYYDETNGSWLEEGTALLEGNSFIGEVTHISTWACSVSKPVVDVSGSLVTNATVLSSKRLKFIDNQTGYISFLSTNESGFFSSRIPEDANLEIEIEHDCSNSSLKANLGAIPPSGSWGPIDIPSDGNSMVQITGLLTNCLGSTSSNSTYLKVDLGQNKYLINTDNGEFDLPFSTSCKDSEISIVGIDIESGFASDEKSELISGGKVNFEQIKLCNEIQAGYDLSHSHINWSDKLKSEVRHSWSVSTILASNKKTIFNPSIVHKDNPDLVYLSGAFAVIENSNKVNYLLKCETQGFSISGVCDVLIHHYDGYSSYRFHNTSEVEISINNSAIFPGVDASDIDMVAFDLVYYD